MAGTTEANSRNAAVGAKRERQERIDVRMAASRIRGVTGQDACPASEHDFAP
jgi:hypothetical protein